MEELTFQQCVYECCSNRQFITEFNRLSGRHALANIYDNRPQITRMIDEATGYQTVLDKQAHEDFQALLMFIMEFVWIPLLVKGVNPAS